MAKPGKDLLPEWEQFVESKDAKAFHDLYIGYYHYFHYLGLKKGFSTPLVEDAIGDLFLYLWENADKMPAVRNHHNYLVTAFINKLVNKKGTGQDQIIDFMEIAELFTVQSAEYEHIAKNVKESVSQIVRSYVDSLPSKQRLMIYQKFYLGLSYNEISAANNVSVRTAYNTIFQAISTLKTSLSKEKGIVLGFFLMVFIFFLFFFQIHW